MIEQTNTEVPIGIEERIESIEILQSGLFLELETIECDLDSTVDVQVVEQTISPIPITLVSSQSPIVPIEAINATITLEQKAVDIIAECKQGPPGPPGDSFFASGVIQNTQSKAVITSDVTVAKFMLYLKQGTKKSYREVTVMRDGCYTISNKFGSKIDVNISPQITLNGIQLVLYNTSLTDTLEYRFNLLTVK